MTLWIVSSEVINPAVQYWDVMGRELLLSRVHSIPQSSLSDAQTGKIIGNSYFNWVFNTFQACQWLWFPGLCDQHLWEQCTMPSVSDVKNVRMGVNCSCWFCIRLIISVLPSHLFLVAAKTFPKGWKEWRVASCGSQLYHMNDSSFRNGSALTAGSLPAQRASNSL